LHNVLLVVFPRHGHRSESIASSVIRLELRGMENFASTWRKIFDGAIRNS
jgi:hypothetical protein